MAERHVIVIGGGLAGLTCAYELGKVGIKSVVLERGGHFGGKVMSSDGYAGMPIEHGVHGWWKGYGNFFDLMKDLHGDDWETQCYGGPYFSRFTAKLASGRIVTMNRPPPVEGEMRLTPFIKATLSMVQQKALSLADAASLSGLLATMIGFDHKKDYARYSTMTASGIADELGVSRRAQELVLANFTLASAFAPLDRISASALFSSANFYILDAQASLAARWLRTHPNTLIFEPLKQRIDMHGDAIGYARVLGVKNENGKVDTVYIDREHGGILALADLSTEPKDILTDPFPKTPPKQLALLRATLRHLGAAYVRLVRGGDDAQLSPEAWSGAITAPGSLSDPRWLKVEYTDADQEQVRVLEDRYLLLGTIDARDVPANDFRELLWEATPNKTTPAEIARLKKNLAAWKHLLVMHTPDLATPPHLPLYVGQMNGELRAYAGICTHFGGRLRFDRGLHLFVCTLHGSRFDCAGKRACGPADANLLPLRLVSIGGGRMRVEIERPPKIMADHVVLATDVSALRNIIQASPTLHENDSIRQLIRLRTTSVTVVRMVVARTVEDRLAVFVGFRALDALFNVTKLQGVQLDAYKNRTHEVIEIQIYRDRTVGQLSREALLDELKKDLKEAYGWSEEPEILDPIHVAVHRDVYSGFDVESESVRPRTRSGAKGLYFAGDWVQPDEGAWYMERGVRTGRLAARAILEDMGRDPKKVPLVPPVRTEWTLRDLARRGESGAHKVARAIQMLLGLNEKSL